MSTAAAPGTAGTPVVDATVPLVYGSDSARGIVRLGRARVHRRSPDGRVVHDPATLERIRGPAIPTAWTEVWISLDPWSHLQATGRDAKGRKQAAVEGSTVRFQFVGKSGKQHTVRATHLAGAPRARTARRGPTRTVRTACLHPWG